MRGDLDDQLPRSPEGAQLSQSRTDVAYDHHYSQRCGGLFLLRNLPQRRLQQGQEKLPAAFYEARSSDGEISCFCLHPLPEGPNQSAKQSRPVVPLTPDVHEGPRGGTRTLRSERSGGKPSLSGSHPREEGPVGIVPEFFRERHFSCLLHGFGGSIQEHTQGLGPSVSFGRPCRLSAVRGEVGRVCGSGIVQEGRPDGKKAFPQLRP